MIPKLIKAIINFKLTEKLKKVAKKKRDFVNEDRVFQHSSRTQKKLNNCFLKQNSNQIKINGARIFV